MRNANTAITVLLVLSMPLFMAAKEDGCAAALSKTDAPDAKGTWFMTYDDKLDVEVTIGGATYTKSLGPQGGAFTIDHDGKPFAFDLNCARPEVVCPSEAWPANISIDQNKPEYQHQMQVTLPSLVCDGAMKTADPSACGQGTDNPDCDKVCDGTTSLKESERFGIIGETGETFRLFLGAGIATNGINCALLGTSVADADFTTTGATRGTSWEAVAMTNGTVTTIYSGSCLWAGDTNGDGDLEALVLGASVKFTTGFTGDKR